jgi:cytochrome c biogenesis protein CcmG, thiol:disulfide interchange protein DsbE
MSTSLRRSLLTFVTIGLICLTGSRLARGQSASLKNETSQPTVNANLPLIDLAAYNQLLAKNHGNPLLVTFWATWCEPCRDEYPRLVDLAKQYTPKGLTVFGVSLDDDADMNLVRHFLAEFRPVFPNYRQKSGIDADGFYHGVNPDWQGTMPETIFYARSGRIVVHFVGEQERATFEQAIHSILATP